MSAKFLDEAARAGFDRAIKTIEKASAVEVVVALRRSSSNYSHANFVVGILAVFGALAFALFAEQTFAMHTVLVDPFVVGALAGWSVQLLPDLKRILTPETVRRAHVVRAAKAAFVERGVHNTAGRSGLLVYISWLEREVALVADSGLAEAIPVATLARIEAAMTDAMARGGEAVARRLEELASHAGAAMARAHDDKNELPDMLDSNLATRRAKDAKSAKDSPKSDTSEGSS